MELTDADRALFEGRNYGHLATLMPDGSPQVSPVWVDIDAQTGLILVNTAMGRVKHRNIERDPRVAISVTDSDDQETMVTVRGRVVELTRDGAEDHIDFLSRKYNGVDFPRHGNRILLKIEADHVARDA
jgi:PPOX class probable F420-dependent enzyme